MEILEFLALGAGMSVEKAMLHREALERQRIGAQLALAREVQANLLPAAPPAQGADAFHGLPGPGIARIRSVLYSAPKEDLCPFRAGRSCIVSV